MPHETALIATVAAGLGLAFVFALAAARLRLPPILGYLLAGVAVGPFTPGYVADQGLAAQLAELGEFSFILAALGLSLGLLPRAAQTLVVAGALLSITLNPFVFAAAARLGRRLDRTLGRAGAGAAPADVAPAGVAARHAP